MSVRGYVEKTGNASIKQLEALNNVTKRIKIERYKLVDKLLNKNPQKTDDSIPW